MGVRSPQEAEHDLLAIAGAGDGRNRAHIGVNPDGGQVTRRTGHVTASTNASGPTEVFVDGVLIFTFELRTCRGAWLSTFDEADYFSLNIDMGWGWVWLSDADDE
jgi:hypothetical protein